MAVIQSITVEKKNAYNGNLLQGLSKVQFNIAFNTAALNGERVFKVLAYINNIEVESQSFLFGNTSSCSITLPTNEYAGKMFPTVKFEISYGKLLSLFLSKETTSFQPDLNVYAYTLPSISESYCIRCNKDGQQDDKEKYISVKVKTVVSNQYPIYNNAINSVKIYTKTRNDASSNFTLAYEARSNTGAMVFGGTYDPEKGYEIRIEVTDLVGGMTTCQDFVTTGTVALEIHQNSAAAFGKNVEYLDGLELAEKWKLRTHEDVYHDKNVHVGGNVYASGEIFPSYGGVYIAKPSGADCILFEVSGIQNNSFIAVDLTIFFLGKASGRCIIQQNIVMFGAINNGVTTNVASYGESNYAASATVNGDGGICKTAFSSASQGTFYFRINDVVKNNSSIQLTIPGTKI